MRARGHEKRKQTRERRLERIGHRVSRAREAASWRTYLEFAYHAAWERPGEIRPTQADFLAWRCGWRRHRPYTLPRSLTPIELIGLLWPQNRIYAELYRRQSPLLGVVSRAAP